MWALEQVQICACEGAIFSRKDVSGHAHCPKTLCNAVSCAEMAEQTEMLLGLWTRCGPNEAAVMQPFSLTFTTCFNHISSMSWIF